MTKLEAFSFGILKFCEEAELNFTDTKRLTAETIGLQKQAGLKDNLVAEVTQAHSQGQSILSILGRYKNLAVINPYDVGALLRESRRPGGDLKSELEKWKERAPEPTELRTARKRQLSREMAAMQAPGPPSMWEMLTPRSRHPEAKRIAAMTSPFYTGLPVGGEYIGGEPSLTKSIKRLYGRDVPEALSAVPQLVREKILEERPEHVARGERAQAAMGGLIEAREPGKYIGKALPVKPGTPEAKKIIAEVGKQPVAPARPAVTPPRGAQLAALPPPERLYSEGPAGAAAIRVGFRHGEKGKPQRWSAAGTYGEAVAEPRAAVQQAWESARKGRPELGKLPPGLA